jgi:hypothetical protein
MIKAPAGLYAMYKDGTTLPILAFSHGLSALVLDADLGQLVAANQDPGFVRIETTLASTPAYPPSTRSAYETRVAQHTANGTPEDDARILALPAPKGWRCPACNHGIIVHRMHGCDEDGCDCTVPHGRILPGDPNPSANPEATCTGITAAWCPVHGDCSCSRTLYSEAIHLDDPACPLHSATSTHGEPPDATDGQV